MSSSLCTDVPISYSGDKDTLGPQSESTSLLDEKDQSQSDEYDAGKAIISSPLQAIGKPDVFWTNGQAICVRFLDGEGEMQEKVEKYAKIWQKYANVRFIFVADKLSHIRISFTPRGKFSSYLGNEALKVEASLPTMTLGFSRAATESDIRRKVLHEFGHALGLVHEHSSPKARIPWNEKKVYAYYKPLGWGEAMVDSQVLRVYNHGTKTQYSKFDPKSIMIYEIPSELTDGYVQVKLNTHLSDTDKEFIGKIYPKPRKSNSGPTEKSRSVPKERPGSEARERSRSPRNRRSCSPINRRYSSGTPKKSSLSYNEEFKSRIAYREVNQHQSSTNSRPTAPTPVPDVASNNQALPYPDAPTNSTASPAIHESSSSVTSPNQYRSFHSSTLYSNQNQRSSDPIMHSNAYQVSFNPKMYSTENQRSSESTMYPAGYQMPNKSTMYSNGYQGSYPSAPHSNR